MNCPNCSNTQLSANVCLNCGYDATLAEKMHNYSNVFYNKGLRQAKKGELTNAIESLSKSIGFNRKNVDAQNLLGLVYFEVGLMGSALKHWVLSVAVKKENNLANDYLAVFQRNPRKMEKYGESLRMYNMALNYINQKSEDMAIIQLKKAVEYNENFIDAMNLLALCYFVSRQRNKASALAERVLEIDATNSTAISYSRELNAGKLRTKPTSRKESEVKKTLSAPAYMLGDSRGFSGGFPLSQLVCLIIGAIAAFFILQMVVLAPKIEEMNLEYEALEEQIAINEASYETKLELKEKEISFLADENERLGNDLIKLEKEIELQNIVQNIQLAQNHHDQGRFTDALAVIESINTDSLSASQLETVEEIKEKCYKQLGELNFTTARSNYNNGQYAQAKGQFELSLKYVLPDSAYVGDAHYFLGRIAEFSGDYETALEHFTICAENYPSAANYNSAVKKVDELS